MGAMIKRLAHRNANVQLYTLEVLLSDDQTELLVDVLYSSPTHSRKTVASMCTENLHREASRMLFYD